MGLAGADQVVGRLPRGRSAGSSGTGRGRTSPSAPGRCASGSRRPPRARSGSSTPGRTVRCRRRAGPCTAPDGRLGHRRGIATPSAAAIVAIATIAGHPAAIPRRLLPVVRMDRVLGGGRGPQRAPRAPIGCRRSTAYVSSTSCRTRSSRVSRRRTSRAFGPSTRISAARGRVL